MFRDPRHGNRFEPIEGGPLIFRNLHEMRGPIRKFSAYAGTERWYGSARA